MNSQYIFTIQLNKLCILAENAQNDYEKACVFSATESLVLRFLKKDNLPHRVSEKIYLIRYHISAFLGYDDPNDLSANDHIHQAIVMTNELIDIIEKMRLDFDKKDKPSVFFKRKNR
ncbi:hypothetical protein [Shewanella surugensis]|uniref:Uncharacterized protein n=1 Tax=Shewanella surugensis TaxID=212020 RepID=A0ABT0LEB9_9GAMM|nr:hypothetical protein [Shewanella surugensis]MCL1125904.1 hypothetical protein [Shewanella surugensis]